MARSLRRWLLGLLLLLVLFLLWRGLRLAWLGWQSMEAVQQLEAAARAQGTADPAAAPLATRLPGLETDLQVLDARLSALARELQPLSPALRSLQAFGSYGQTLAAAPDLLSAAQEMAAAAAQMGPHLDWLLGMDAPRTYLVLVQNNHELRATGGFISAFGSLVIDQGRIADLTFADSYELFSLQSEYPPAPQPMQQYMGIQLLVPRDANWSPDLPTAAQTIRRLYTADSRQAVDGIITLDLNAVRHLVGALGSVSVEGVATPITAENVEGELVRLWEQPLESTDADAAGPGEANGDWWSRRKDFVPLVAEAALARLQSGDVDTPKLAAALHAALNDRSIQLWLDHPQLQAVLAEHSWDGGLHPPADGDFLAVVDSNLGYNKVDAAMQRAVEYSVTWPDGPNQPAQAVLTLTYTHTVQAVDPLCDPSPRYGKGYADLIARCYFDYVRVYTPSNSRLIDVEGIEPQTVTSEGGEGGAQQFGGYFVVKPNSVKQITFVYQLPPAVTQENYTLVVQRQAGTQPLPLHLTVKGLTQAALLADGQLTWDPTLTTGP